MTTPDPDTKPTAAQTRRHLAYMKEIGPHFASMTLAEAQQVLAHLVTTIAQQAPDPEEFIDKHCFAVRAAMKVKQSGDMAGKEGSLLSEEPA